MYVYTALAYTQFTESVLCTDCYSRCEVFLSTVYIHRETCLPHLSAQIWQVHGSLSATVCIGQEIWHFIYGFLVRSRGVGVGMGALWLLLLLPHSSPSHPASLPACLPGCHPFPCLPTLPITSEQAIRHTGHLPVETVGDFGLAFLINALASLSEIIRCSLCSKCSKV